MVFWQFCVIIHSMVAACPSGMTRVVQCADISKLQREWHKIFAQNVIHKRYVVTLFVENWQYSVILYSVNLALRIHDIIPRFLIWPTFQGHRGQSSSGNVSRAHFVTAGASDLKLCTYVPLGHLTKFRSDLILCLATMRGPKPKTQNLLTPQLIIAELSPNYIK
jgi:hypothetical protein